MANCTIDGSIIDNVNSTSCYRDSCYVSGVSGISNGWYNHNQIAGTCTVYSGYNVQIKINCANGSHIQANGTCNSGTCVDGYCGSQTLILYSKNSSGSCIISNPNYKAYHGNSIGCSSASCYFDSACTKQHCYFYCRNGSCSCYDSPF